MVLGQQSFGGFDRQLFSRVSGYLRLPESDLLTNPVSFDSFNNNALLQLGYIVVFGTLAYGRFATKDVLS